MRIRSCLVLPLIFVCSPLVSPADAAPIFTELSGIATPLGVSPDGSTVVGAHVTGPAPDVESFRWTLASGLTSLGDLPGGGVYSYAWDASTGGTTIVGQGATATASPEAYVWTAGSGMVSLGAFPEGVGTSYAHAVSADGSVVAGASSRRLGNEAFRWTAATGMVGLGDLPGGGFESAAVAMSADGSVIVGSGWSDSGTEAALWTASGMIGLGDLPGGTFRSIAYDVSADGSTVIGYGTSASGTEAFRWTAATGMVGLGDLPGGSFQSTADGVSADGSIIVGSSVTSGSSGYEAFIWDADHGMRLLKQVLEQEFGLDLTGWTLEGAGISADGGTLFGKGTNPQNRPAAWVVTGLSVPEPGTGAYGLVVVLSFLLVGSWRRASARRCADPVSDPSWAGETA